MESISRQNPSAGRFLFKRWPLQHCLRGAPLGTGQLQASALPWQLSAARRCGICRNAGQWVKAGGRNRNACLLWLHGLGATRQAEGKNHRRLTGLISYYVTVVSKALNFCVYQQDIALSVEKLRLKTDCLLQFARLAAGSVPAALPSPPPPRLSRESWTLVMRPRHGFMTVYPRGVANGKQLMPNNCCGTQIRGALSSA